MLDGADLAAEDPDEDPEDAPAVPDEPLPEDPLPADPLPDDPLSDDPLPEESDDEEPDPPSFALPSPLPADDFAASRLSVR